MTDIGGVGFEIRLSELRKAQKHLLFNRGAFKETDCADLLVSPCVATFRTVGTEFEAPVKGKSSWTGENAAQNAQATRPSRSHFRKTGDQAAL